MQIFMDLLNLMIAPCDEQKWNVQGRTQRALEAKPTPARVDDVQR